MACSNPDDFINHRSKLDSVPFLQSSPVEILFIAYLVSVSIGNVPIWSVMCLVPMPKKSLININEQVQVQVWLWTGGPCMMNTPLEVCLVI